jgi:hypothetical protein
MMEEDPKYDALIDQLDAAFDQVMRYLAVKADHADMELLPDKERERILIQAAALVQAWDDAQTDEGGEDDETVINEGLAYLADLDRDLMQLLARHHAIALKLRALGVPV